MSNAWWSSGSCLGARRKLASPEFDYHLEQPHYAFEKLGLGFGPAEFPVAGFLGQANSLVMSCFWLHCVLLSASLAIILQAFPGHRGIVSCLCFRQENVELFSGSYDRTIKMWNAEDRACLDTSFGHQAEILTIDALRRERVVSVGRDKTMHLFKV